LSGRLSQPCLDIAQSCRKSTEVVGEKKTKEAEPFPVKMAIENIGVADCPARPVPRCAHLPEAAGSPECLAQNQTNSRVTVAWAHKDPINSSHTAGTAQSSSHSGPHPAAPPRAWLWLRDGGGEGCELWFRSSRSRPVKSGALVSSRWPISCSPSRIPPL
jgi:hypothetical protein